ncbi:MAG: lamin tail domain-containing protein [Rubrivivax sp.]|nr:lamin tail domain-containing protein [Pyrinomonadaceae bacterium]
MPSPTPFTSVVVSQIYGGAGCATANCSTFRNDFIELFNRGPSAVSLHGWSVQYASATSMTSWQVTPLTNVMLASGQYYLIQESGNANGVSPLPTPEAIGTIPMSASAGKIALVNTTVALSGTCPTGAGVIDLVGYGTTANCSETAPAPAPSTTTAVIRNESGCTDANNNASDFATATPNPRNSASPINLCAGGAQTETGAVLFARTLPLFIFFFSSDRFSARRPREGLRRWRKADAAYAPRGMHDAPPRPRGASP